MKKLLSIIIAVTLFFTLWTFQTVLADDEKVEIGFCVGDETLIINGESVTVEKPYVVGDGVTLVPLRVITEAFGAEVEWIAETKTINLSYPDVTIILQIDNPVAEVNGKAEQLLSAPQLTPTGFTMVPLRFISETFGADVSYDDATRRITVVKTSVGSSSTVEGAVTNKNIGDSYYNWSMENPKDMVMEYRSFDGTFTAFSDENDNHFGISIITLYDEFDFEKSFVSTKSAIASDEYTLVKADKSPAGSEIKSMHFQAKNKYEFVDIRYYITDKYHIELYGSFNTENTEVKDEIIRIMSTFTTNFKVNDVYDLSTVKNGYRKFESDKLKLSFNVPQNFVMTSSDDLENKFEFNTMDQGDEISGMNVVVYSKSEVGSAEELANSDYNHNKQYYNEEITRFNGEVKARQYGSINAYEYEMTIKYEILGDKYMRDVFFELGDYVYNISVSQKIPSENYDSRISSIISSVNAEEIDASEVGILMRNVPDATGTFAADFGDFTVDMPNNFLDSGASNGVAYLNPISGVIITMQQAATTETTFEKMKTQMKEAQKIQAQRSDTTVVSSTADINLGNYKFLRLGLKIKNDTDVNYIQQFVMVKGGIAYVFNVGYPEDTYSDYSRNEVKEILSSVKFK